MAVLGELLGGIDTHSSCQGHSQHVGSQVTLLGSLTTLILLGISLNLLVGDGAADLGIDGDELLSLLVSQLDAHGLAALLVDELHEGSQHTLSLIPSDPSTRLDETADFNGVKLIHDNTLYVPAVGHPWLVLVGSKLPLSVLNSSHNVNKI